MYTRRIPERLALGFFYLIPHTIAVHGMPHTCRHAIVAGGSAYHAIRWLYDHKREKRGGAGDQDFLSEKIARTRQITRPSSRAFITPSQKINAESI